MSPHDLNDYKWSQMTSNDFKWLKKSKVDKIIYTYHKHATLLKIALSFFGTQSDTQSETVYPRISKPSVGPELELPTSYSDSVLSL